MSNYVTSSPEITRRLITILESAKEQLGIKRVYYGDQDLIPDFPAICVESGTKDRGLSSPGSTRRFALVLSSTIYVYFGEVRSSEFNIEEVEKLTEEVEQVIHNDFTLGGAVIFGFVSKNEPGYRLKAQTMIKTSRLVWDGQSRQDF